METKRILRLSALLGLVALVGAACAGGSDLDATAATPTASETVTSASTGAAELRETLTTGLQEHEYLAGIAVYAAVNTGVDSDVTTAAVGALDENSVALSEAIGSIYGDDARKAFLPLWRNHIDFFVSYTVGGVTGDKAAQKKAKRDLDEYRADFGAFLGGANPNLTKEAVAEALIPHVESTFDAIDAVVAKKPSAFMKLREGGAALRELGGVLAGAIAPQFPDMFDGDAASGGAALRATLSALLQEHEYFAGIAVFNAVNFGLEHKQTAGAIKALGANTRALGDAIGSVYGDDARKAFIPLWEKHIGFFVSYTVGGVTDDQAKQDKAKADLDEYRADFGAFLGGANPNLTKDAVAEALIPHVESTFDAIDAVVAKDDTQFSKLREGASKLPPIGAVIADAIVKQFPEQF